MSRFERHTGLSTCLCPECMLIHCGAVDRDWPGWKDVEFASYARVTMMQLVGQPPVRWVGPRQHVAGCIPWFDHAGVGLVFDEEDHDE